MFYFSSCSCFSMGIIFQNGRRKGKLGTAAIRLITLNDSTHINNLPYFKPLNN